MENAEIATFFANQEVKIVGNSLLREPQRDGYFRIKDHFSASREPGFIQLPVGCGKTGLMGLAPFRVTMGRVLIVVPNLTIRGTVLRELDISDPNCFYSKRGIFMPQTGPFMSELKTGANLHDCDAAHIVVANIQQFTGRNNKWYEKFPRDYFRMILVDEGHHNVAESWRRLFDYFDDALVVSFTATPTRSDGQRVLGQRLYSFSYVRSMIMGFIAPIDALFVHPEQVTFTAQGETRTLQLAEVLEMREHDWFSKGIALSEACNRHIAAAAVQQLREVRRFGGARQIIAVACSIRHAAQVAGCFREHGLNVEVLHSELPQERRDSIEAGLRAGLVDVVVQVQMLGEGYDLGTLSVAAVFRPYRSLSPYIQFVGRILRLAEPTAPASPGNRAYLVSHIGLNDERWWEDFRRFDAEDQQFFAEFFAGEEEVSEGEAAGQRLTLRPFMRVLNETVEKYVQKTFLKEVDEVMVQDLLDTIRSKGFEPSEFGLTEEMVRMRLEMAAQAEREVAAFAPPIQPQRMKEALRTRAYQEARSIADTVVNRLGLKHGGRDLLRLFQGRGDTNIAILITLALGYQNKQLGGKRDDASVSQLEAALAATADIADALTSAVRKRLKPSNEKNEITTQEVRG
jgi:superfamily II DNA or RNA helicase